MKDAHVTFDFCAMYNSFLQKNKKKSKLIVRDEKKWHDEIEIEQQQQMHRLKKVAESII